MPLHPCERPYFVRRPGGSGAPPRLLGFPREEKSGHAMLHQFLSAWDIRCNYGSTHGQSLQHDDGLPSEREGSTTTSQAASHPAIASGDR